MPDGFLFPPLELCHCKFCSRRRRELALCFKLESEWSPRDLAEAAPVREAKTCGEVG